MRISRRIPIITQLLALFLLFVALEAASQAQEASAGPATIRVGTRSYSVLDMSPNHRYALVWGLRKRQIDFARLSTDEDYRDSVFSFDRSDPDVINGIVDCSHHRLIARIVDCHHVPTLNHSSLDAIWAPNGKYVAIYWDGKWAPLGIYVATLSGPSVGNVADLFPKLFHAVNHAVSVATHGASIPNRDNHEVDCDLNFESAGRLVVSVSLLPYKLNAVPSYGVTFVFDPTIHGVFGTRDPTIRGKVRSLD